MIAKVSVLITLFFSVNFYAQNSIVKPSQNTPEDELQRRINAAETFQISGDLLNAEIENRAIVALGLQRFGNIAVEEGKYQDAVKMFSESKVYNDNSRIRIDLAIAYLQLNELDEALEEARTAVSLDEKNG